MAESAYRPNKTLSRQHLVRVRELFMREWDPIGVADVPQAQDEYDTYVGKAYALLMIEQASAEKIAQYLFWVETEYMGLSATENAREKCSRVANAMIGLRSDFEAEYRLLDHPSPS